MSQQRGTPVYWIPDANSTRIGQLLGCPKFGDRAPHIDRAWTEQLALRRSECASRLMAKPEDEKERSAYMYWNRPSEQVRKDEADALVYSFGKVWEGYGEEFIARPSHEIAYEVTQLSLQPFLWLSLGQIEGAQAQRSPDALIELSDQIDAHYHALYGAQLWQAALKRDLEPHLNAALMPAPVFARHGEGKNPSSLTLVMAHLDALRQAAGFARWCAFWSNNGIGIKPLFPA